MISDRQLASWLRWLVYASALIPLVIFAQYLSPFHFGKVIVFRAIVEVMLVLYVLLAWRDRSYLPKAHPITWAFLAFTLAFTLTTITSVSPLPSFWGTLERMGGLFTFWHYFAFYIIAVSVLRSKEDWRTLLDLMVAVGLVSAIYGFLQKTDWSSFILGAGNRTRPFGTIGNAALFAGYQIVIAFLAVTLLFTKRLGPNAPMEPGLAEKGGKILAWGLGAAFLLALLSLEQGLWVVPVGLVSYGAYLLAAAMGKARWFYGIAAALMFVAIITTAVRGSLLGIGVGAIIFALLWSTFSRSKRSKTVLLGLLAGAVLFFFLAILLRSTSLVKDSGYLSRITDFSSSTYTVQTRFWAWSAGLNGWSENPRYMLAGWGPENFNIPFSKYFNPKFFTGPGAETFFDRAHNTFIEFLVTMGLVGLLTYLALLGALLWTLVRFTRHDDDRRVLGIGLTAMTVAYAIHNSFIFDTSANFLVFFTVLAFVVHVAQRGLDGEVPAARLPAGKPKHSRLEGRHLGAGAVMSVAAAALIIVTGVQPTMANYAATRGIVAGWRGDFMGAVNSFREAIEYDTPGRYEFRHRFAQYLLEISAVEDADEKVPQLKDVVARAITDVERNIAQSPHDYLPLLYLSRLHLVLGKGDPASPHNNTALDYSMRALEISPTFVRTYYEVAQAYLNKQDFAKAYEWFGKAAELNPDVPITRWYMALVLIQQGQLANDNALIRRGLEEAAVALQMGYPMTESDVQKLVAAYVRLGDFESVANIYLRLLSSFPDRSLYWEQLVAVYLRMGNSDLAIKAIRQALAQPGVAADQAFQKKAQNTLKELGVK